MKLDVQERVTTAKDGEERTGIGRQEPSAGNKGPILGEEEREGRLGSKSQTAVQFQERFSQAKGESLSHTIH